MSILSAAFQLSVIKYVAEGRLGYNKCGQNNAIELSGKYFLTPTVNFDIHIENIDLTMECTFL